MTFQLYAQRDPRWAGIALGQRTLNAKGQLITMGSDGCVICSLASASGIEPPELNRKLLLANQFYGASVYLNSINYGLVFDNKLEYLGQSQWYEDAVPAAHMEAFRNELRAGEPSVLCLDSRPDMAGRQYHYVLAVGVEESTGGIIVNDSWYAVTAVLSQINRIWYKRIFRGLYGQTDAIAIWRRDRLRVRNT